MMKLPTWSKIALGIAILLFLGVWLKPYFQGTATLNPILINLGPIAVHWYGLTMALGILSSAMLAISLVKGNSDFDSEDVIAAITWSVIGGLIFARILFVVLKWPEYQNNLHEIFLVQKGGLSIHGGIIGGCLGLYLYTRAAKQKFLPLLDLFAAVLPLGQIIGRFGNFFNQEAFGGPTSLPWKMFVSPANRPAGYEIFKFFHPTFLYEAIGSAIVLWLLQKLYKKPHAPGEIALAYLILYSVVRFAVEFFRIDSDRLLSISFAQWASLAIIVLGGIFWIRLRRK